MCVAGKSVPKGTILAVLLEAFCYLLVMLICAATAQPALLKNTEAITYMAGVCALTLSLCLPMYVSLRHTTHRSQLGLLSFTLPYSLLASALHFLCKFPRPVSWQPRSKMVCFQSSCSSPSWSVFLDVKAYFCPHLSLRTLSARFLR